MIPNFAPTRFPTVPALTEKQRKQMSQAEQLEYLAEKAHHDKWGHLPPQVHQQLRGVAELAENAVENHARTVKTDPVHFAAAKAYYKWPIGQEMELEEYEAAVEHVVAQPHGI